MDLHGVISVKRPRDLSRVVKMKPKIVAAPNPNLVGCKFPATTSPEPSLLTIQAAL